MVARNQTAEDSSPLIQWLPRSAWSNGNSQDDQLPKYSQGSFMLTTTLNAQASFSFNGTGIWIYGAKRSNHGPYQCAIDGVPLVQQSGFSAQPQIQALLCGFSGYSMGPHVATITNHLTDPTNAPYLDVDFIVWETELSDSATLPTTVVDDANSALVYAPPRQWNANQCDSINNYWASTCHITSSTTASVSYTFSGDAVAIYGGVGPTYGSYTVKLDDNTPGQYNASGTNQHAQELLYFASGLGPGNHTVKLANNPDQVGDMIDVDYFQVLAGYPEDSTSGSNGGSANKHKGVNAGAIVAPIVVVLLLIVGGIVGFLYWRRRKAAQNKHVDLNGDDHGPKDEFTAMNMGMIPTPYNLGVPSNNSSTASQTPLAPGLQHISTLDQPIANWQGRTEYSTSDPSSPPHTDYSFAQQPQPQFANSNADRASIAQTTYTVPDVMSASGSGSGGGSVSGSVAGGGSRMPPLSAVGGKAANLYHGPTVRNDDGVAGGQGGLGYPDVPPAYN